ncbi:kinase-like protein [Lentinus tigrinus ALCF2SS1-6]|uniref:Kinase-like protein n=1 Tax=Lentinus tigrinus ALCF2SS1-6 TaxID=1328759 RepID=A0A5C2SR41_9APHY|nr:kinase-like protein [Lentinus tigrinus ALCF2SS1-6]
MTIADGDIELLELLGHGAQGVVFRAIRSDDTSPEPKQYAVKIMEKASPNTSHWRGQQRELRAHMEVADHKNVCGFYGYYETSELIYMVLEYCPGGDLLHALIERRLYTRDDELLKSIYVQLLDAVQHCHENNIYHRDLKPDNIMINGDGTEIRLADFGLATTSKISDNFGHGSPPYMSPECLGQDLGYEPFSTEANDVWALGVILCNLVAGRSPWGCAMMRDKLFRRYVRNPGYLREMMPISAECADILEATFHPLTSRRITIPELRKRILETKTLFMSEEELAKGSRSLQQRAASYWPKLPPLDPPVEAIHRQSICADEEAIAMLGQVSNPFWRNAIVNMRFEDEDGHLVISPSTGIPLSESSCSSSSSIESSDYSCSSGEESKGPCTPASSAQSLATDFPSNEKIDKALVPPIARKGTRVVIAVPAA